MKILKKKDLIRIIEPALLLGAIQPSETAVQCVSKSAEEIALAFFEDKIIIDLEETKKKTAELRYNYGNEYIGTYILEKEDSIEKMVVQHIRMKDDSVGVGFSKYSLKDDKVIHRSYLGKEELFKEYLKHGFQKVDSKEYKDLEIGVHPLKELEGYTPQQAEDIILDAIAQGVIEMRHCEIWPHHHGFEMIYHGHTYPVDVEPFDVPMFLRRSLQLGKYSFSLQKIEKEVQQKKDEIKESYVPYVTTSEYKQSLKPGWRGHIADYEDINKGYAIDGIIEGNCHGDYSSMTTGTQNSWMQAATALRGYCLDYVVAHNNFPYRNKILHYFKENGLDLENHEMLERWCQENKGICWDKKYVREYEKEKELQTEYAVYQEALRDINEIYEKTNSFKSVNKSSIGTKEYDVQLQGFLSKTKFDITNTESINSKEYLMDFNYNHTTGTLYVHEDLGCRVDNSFEIWNDEDSSYYGCFTKEELSAKKQNLEDLIKPSVDGEKKIQTIHTLDENLVSFNGYTFEVSFDSIDIDNIQYKWHNYRFQDINNPKHYYVIQIAQDSIVVSPRFLLEKFTNYYFDVYGEWVELSDVVKDRKEVEMIENYLIERSNQDILKNFNIRDFFPNEHREYHVYKPETNEFSIIWYNSDGNDEKGTIRVDTYPYSELKKRNADEKFYSNSFYDEHYDEFEHESISDLSKIIELLDSKAVISNDEVTLEKITENYLKALDTMDVDLSFLQDGCLVEDILTEDKEDFINRYPELSRVQVDKAYAWANKTYNLEDKWNIFLSGELYLASRIPNVSDGINHTSYYHFEQVHNKDDQFNVQIIYQTDGAVSYFAQNYEIDNHCQSSWSNWQDLESFLGDDYDYKYTIELMNAMEEYSCRKQEPLFAKDDLV